ncbi:MAG: NAD-dependent epimerase/dehydratase family protein [Sphingobacteriales bacterium]|nr:MAG: NAD-dependent epimerase/dehydratase family protein [Sphingobacteriales bacterium]
MRTLVFSLGPNMRTLIVGATGLVGSYLISHLDNHEVVGMARNRPDWYPLEREFVGADVFTPNFAWDDFLSRFDRVIFLAFPTHLDRLEVQAPELNSKLIDAYDQFSEAAFKHSVPVLFFSSDAVLWGLDFVERGVDAKPARLLNHYAQLKWTCEKLTLAKNKKSTVLRCTPVGIHAFDSTYGFVGSILEGSKRREVFGFKDTLFTPVSIQTLLRFCEQWLDSKFEKGMVDGQIIHIGSTDCLSKFEFLSPLVKEVGGTLQSGLASDHGFIAKRNFDQRIIASQNLEINKLQRKKLGCKQIL